VQQTFVDVVKRVRPEVVQIQTATRPGLGVVFPLGVHRADGDHTITVSSGSRPAEPGG
jgi:hypothetical protein